MVKEVPVGVVESEKKLVLLWRARIITVTANVPTVVIEALVFCPYN